MLSSEQSWRNLVAESVKQPIELQTKNGLHFKVSSNGKMLTVCASERKPSCELKAPLNIYIANFNNVFPYYKRWASQ